MPINILSAALLLRGAWDSSMKRVRSVQLLTMYSMALRSVLCGSDL